MQRNLNCLRISYIIKNHRQLYQRIFRNANDPRSMGDLTCFVIEFLRLIELALEDTYAVLQEKYRAYEHYQARLQECVNRREKALHKYGSVLWLMMQAKLFGDGYFDVLELAYSCDLSPNTIRRIAGLFPGLIVQEREGNRMMYHLDLEWLDRAEQG